MVPSITSDRGSVPALRHVGRWSAVSAGLLCAFALQQIAVSRDNRAPAPVDAPRAELRASFAAGGATVAVPGGRLRLALAGVGRGGRIHLVSATMPFVAGAAVVYRRHGISEWYRRASGALEQGFDVARPPTGAGARFDLLIAASGALRPRLSSMGVGFHAAAGVLLSYGGLMASDAAGRRLPATVALRGSAILLSVRDRGARYPIRVDPLIAEGSTMLSGQGQGLSGRFGASVALSGDGATALVGSPAAAGGGVAWVFVHHGNWWAQLQKPLGPTAGAVAFGASVALSGDAEVALVGDPGAGRASAYVRAGAGAFQPLGALSPENADVAGFGGSVSLSADGDSALVGAAGPGGAGGAWLFIRSGSGPFRLASALVAPVGGGGFGSTVALSGDGDTALVAAPRTGNGAVWLFQRSGPQTFSPTSELSVPGRSAFGSSAALAADGRTALVGAPEDDSGAGSAWLVGESSPGSYRLAGRLTAPAVSAGFGASVSLSADGQSALIGAPGSASGGSGRAWLFGRSTGRWRPMSSAPVAAGGAAGSSVALSTSATALAIGDPADRGGAGSVLAQQLRRVDGAPACFGAAALSPRRGCRSSRDATTVVPSPADALITPGAPCSLVGGDGLINSCAFGAPAADARAAVALIGDSHAINWRGALEVVARDEGWEGFSIERSGCPYTFATRDLPEPLRGQCTERDRAVPGWLAQHPEVSTVFVAEHTGGDVATSGGRSSFAADVAGYRQAWTALPRSVRHVIVLRDNPQVPDATLPCVEKAIADHVRPDARCDVPRRDALRDDPAVAAARSPAPGRVQVVDLTRYFCDPRVCFPVIGGVLVYKDANHLTDAYSTTLGPYLEHAVKALVSGGAAAHP
jgi:hypothetical protein